VPDDLIDAGRIDGAGEFRIWWSIHDRRMRLRVELNSPPLNTGSRASVEWATTKR
jgi:hypothetical protein